jgi:tRNA-dihydrouridine synthase
MSSPFLLAPMAELSHRALRELIESFGPANEYFTEMISAYAFVNGARLRHGTLTMALVQKNWSTK